MPARSPIRRPNQAQTEEQIDLDELTRDLSNKRYNQNSDPDAPEKVFKTSLDLPEHLKRQIDMEVFKNKYQDSGPKTNKGVIMEAIKSYFENKPKT